MQQKPLECYYCHTPVAIEKLVITIARENNLRLEYTCPNCQKWIKFGYRDSYVFDPHWDEW